MYVSCDTAYRSTVLVLCWRCVRRVPNIRYSELPYQYNIRLCCLLTSWIFGVLSIICVLRVDRLFGNFTLLLSERHSDVKRSSTFQCVTAETQFWHKRNLCLNLQLAALARRTHRQHSTSTVLLLYAVSQLTYIQFRISVVLSIFIDSYSAF
jgi:hypothetical protein